MNYFESIPSLHRSIILVSGITLFWLLEGAVPLFRFSYRKWRHALPNFFFTPVIFRSDSSNIKVEFLDNNFKLVVLARRLIRFSGIPSVR